MTHSRMRYDIWGWRFFSSLADTLYLLGLHIYTYSSLVSRVDHFSTMLVMDGWRALLLPRQIENDTASRHGISVSCFRRPEL